MFFFNPFYSRKPDKLHTTAFTHTVNNVSNLTHPLSGESWTNGSETMEGNLRGSRYGTSTDVRTPRRDKLAASCSPSMAAKRVGWLILENKSRWEYRVARRGFWPRHLLTSPEITFMNWVLWYWTWCNSFSFFPILIVLLTGLGELQLNNESGKLPLLCECFILTSIPGAGDVPGGGRRVGSCASSTGLVVSAKHADHSGNCTGCALALAAFSQMKLGLSRVWFHLEYIQYYRCVSSTLSVGKCRW